MGVDRVANSKFRIRPKKGAGDKRRRVKAQRKRLVGLGLPEAQVARMNSKDLRTVLARPAKIAAK